MSEREKGGSQCRLRSSMSEREKGSLCRPRSPMSEGEQVSQCRLRSTMSERTGQRMSAKVTYV